VDIFLRRPRYQCFVLMPFAPTLKYFYLFIKNHLESTHRIVCERADAQIELRGVWEKIEGKIRGADLVLADLSGNNPNVFLELGFALALLKPENTILITSDDRNTVPIDIRWRELIRYELDNDAEFLRNLDSAVGSWLLAKYTTYHQAASAVFERFRHEAQGVSMVSNQLFLERVKAAYAEGELAWSDAQEQARVLLRLATESTRSNHAEQIEHWVESNYSASVDRERERS
jgi:nucleoside 2-deoxyribosyltransferase